MGRQQKQFKQLSSSESLALAKQELMQGNWKEALNRALSCFKSIPGPEQRSLLERAYVGRIRELTATGLPERALERFYELMQLDPQVPAVVAELPLLRVRLGIGNETDQAAALQAEPDLAAAVVVEGVDRAVLRQSAGDPAIQAEIQAEVDKVLAALLAIERGDDRAAEDLLKDLSRSSPLADWKLFARGLSAFYARDLARSQANWNRLTPQRPALRIAQTLLVAGGHLADGPAPSDVSASVRRLQNAAPRSGSSDELERLAAAWKAKRWRDFLFALRDLRQRGGAERIKLLNEVGELAWRRFAREGRRHELGQLIGILPAPALDPNWNRAQAMAAERCESFDWNVVQELWLKYVQDVALLATIKDSERPLVTALVFRHLAKVCAHRAWQREMPPYQRSEADAKKLRTQAASHFRCSAKHAPALCQTYREWVKLHLDTEQQDQAAKVYDLFARACPDEWQPHDWLAAYYLADDDAERAAPHIEELVRLRPREPKTRLLQWNQQVTVIRGLAKKRKFDAARDAMRQLESLIPPNLEPMYLDLVQASVEYKAKELAVAEAHVTHAIARVAEPTIVWMILSSNVARYGIDKDSKKLFDARLKDALDRSPTSDTAGRIALYLCEQAGSANRYSGQVTHVRLAVKYLQRCKKLVWAPHDLRTVCRFLQAAERRNYQLTEKFLAVGQQLFPTDPFFPAMNGLNEMNYGPFNCNRSMARRELERAVELNRSATDPLFEAELQSVQQGLALLESDPEPFHFDDEFDIDEEFHDEEFVGSFQERGGKHDAGDAGPRLPDFSNLGISIVAMLKMMPPQLRRMMEQQAAQEGIPLSAMLAKILGGKIP